MTLSKVDSGVPEPELITGQAVPADSSLPDRELVSSSKEGAGLLVRLRNRISSLFTPRQLNEGSSGLIVRVRDQIDAALSYLDGIFFPPPSKPSQVAEASGQIPLADTA